MRLCRRRRSSQSGRRNRTGRLLAPERERAISRVGISLSSGSQQLGWGFSSAGTPAFRWRVEVGISSPAASQCPLLLLSAFLLQVETHSILAPGTVLPPGRRIPEGQLWAGNPARFVRLLTKASERAMRELAVLRPVPSLEMGSAAWVCPSNLVPRSARSAWFLHRSTGDNPLPTAECSLRPPLPSLPLFTLDPAGRTRRRRSWRWRRICIEWQTATSTSSTSLIRRPMCVP